MSARRVPMEPAGAPAHAMTDTSRPAAAPPADDRFVRRDRREILGVLRRLAAEEVAVLVTFGGEGDALHTRVVEVAGDGRAFVLEWGPDDHVSQRVIDAGTVSCQAELDNVRLHFAIEPTPGRHRYLKAFAARVPDVVLRVQRREYYRLAIGPDDGVACSLVLPHPGGESLPTAVALIDLSGGGMAARVPMAAGARLRLHTELTGCRLTLADAGVLDTRVRVRNLTRTADAQGQPWVRVGCQFLDLRVGHVAQLQRLIGDIERRRRADERRRAEREAMLAARRSDVDHRR